jgi:hypothetical protein
MLSKSRNPETDNSNLEMTLKVLPVMRLSAYA